MTPQTSSITWPSLLFVILLLACSFLACRLWLADIPCAAESAAEVVYLDVVPTFAQSHATPPADVLDINAVPASTTNSSLAVKLFDLDLQPISLDLAPSVAKQTSGDLPLNEHLPPNEHGAATLLPSRVNVLRQVSVPPLPPPSESIQTDVELVDGELIEGSLVDVALAVLPARGEANVLGGSLVDVALAVLPARGEADADRVRQSKIAAKYLRDRGELSQPTPTTKPVTGTTRAATDEKIGPPSFVAVVETGSAAAPPTVSAPTPAGLPSPWPVPHALITQMEKLDQRPELAAYLDELEAELRQLRSLPSLDDAAAGGVIARLRLHEDQLCGLSESVNDETLRDELLRFAYALSRRLHLWAGAHELAVESGIVLEPATINSESVRAQLVATEAELSNGEHWPSWKSYLMLHELKVVADEPLADESSRRELARLALERLGNPHLEREQREFLRHESLVRLSTALRPWVAEPVNCELLLAAVEAMEHSPTTAIEQYLGRACLHLRYSGVNRNVEFGNVIEKFWRNANVRFAVSEKLLRNLLPQSDKEYGDVGEFFHNAWISGDSWTTTHLSVRLLPDDSTWRIRLEADGAVNSSTTADSRSVRVFNQGVSNFHARKLVVVDHDGIHVADSIAQADSWSDVTGLDTDFDDIPLISNLVRIAAISQADALRDEADYLFRSRVMETVTQRLDEEVDAALQQASNDLSARLLDQLDMMQLDAVPIELRTTEQRVIGRYRLASENQLGSNTLRPLAPGNSWISTQAHQSAVNNLLEQLGLEGRTFKLEDLLRHVASQLKAGEPEIPDDLPEGVIVRFAKKAAVRVAFESGRVRLTIRVAKLTNADGESWRQITATGFYVPDLSRNDGHLQRDGSINLTGRRLSFGDQVKLRAIFSRTMSKKRGIALVPSALFENPRMPKMKQSQFDINDGWVGVAWRKAD
jgi:hypothetical protein